MLSLSHSFALSLSSLVVLVLLLSVFIMFYSVFSFPLFYLPFFLVYVVSYASLLIHSSSLTLVAHLSPSFSSLAGLVLLQLLFIMFLTLYLLFFLLLFFRLCYDLCYVLSLFCPLYSSCFLTFHLCTCLVFSLLSAKCLLFSLHFTFFVLL